jgi:hypothetical protein
MAEVFAFIPLSARPSRGSRRSGASKEKKTKEGGHGTAGRVERNPLTVTMDRKELHALALVLQSANGAAIACARPEDL